MNKLAVAVCLLLGLDATAIAAPPSPAAFVAALGGTLNDPVSADSYSYVAAGTTITAWSRSQAGAPLLVGDTRTTPADGWLTGLVRRGDYLYASYRGYVSTIAGVAVYSIANRASPVLLGQYAYSAAPLLFAQSVAIANDHLYLLDSENGIYVSALTDPAHPVFSLGLAGWGSYDQAYAEGNRLYAVGRNFISSTVLDIFDVSTPATPQLVGSTSLDGFDNFRLKVQGPYAYGFGTAVNVTDISNAANITPRGRIDAPVAYEGVLLGTSAWSVGLEGLDMWNIANPDVPAALGHSAIDTFATDATATATSEVLLATRADRFVRLDASNPAQPALLGAAVLPGGTAAMDLAIAGDTALILGNAYGLGIADAATLAPVGRYETSLPASLQGRAFEQFAIGNQRAYLASWGTGVVIADISNPRQPVELGVWNYGFATAIAVNGNTAYVGRSTNGGELVVLDVTNPAQPQPRGTLTTSKVMRLVHRDHFVFVADEAEFGDTGGGLLIVDVANPDQPVVVGSYTGCGSARDVALNAAGTLAAVACTDTTHIVDVRNRSNPQAYSVHPTGGEAVALRGTTVYISTSTGLDEVDISNPATPVPIGHRDLAAPPRRVVATADARVFALTDLGGIYVYAADRLFADGLQAN